MTSNWKTLPLGAVAEIVGGGTPSTKEAKYWDGDVPWITPKDLSGHTSVFISEGERCITNEGLAKSSAKLIPANSVLYTSRAPIGYVAINTVPVATNQGFKSLVPKADFDYKYLYYLLKNSKNEVLAFASGGTFAEIGAAALSEVQLPFPPLEVQRAIGATLLNLDSKIEANQRTALLLEQIAQTIFKSWFVDFDPVHARARGEQPEGMDAETAALFPDSFEDSELGPIPAGWTVRPSAEIFDFSIGRTPPRKEPEWFCEGANGVPWVSIRDMGNFGVYTALTDEGLHESAVSKFRVPVVPPGTVLMSFKLTLGRVAIARVPLTTNEAIAHFIPRESDSLPSEFAYLWLKNLDYTGLDSTSSIGTATNSSLVKQILFLKPSTQVVEQFVEVCKPMFEQIRNLTLQSETLSKIRDSLLPRLISGELEIPEELLGE